MSTITRHDGTLEINPEEGTIKFIQYGTIILNITHLRTPIPPNMTIELVALPALTSYQPHPRGEHETFWPPDELKPPGWEGADDEPLDELDTSGMEGVE
jgi:hypothetical protein